MVVYVRDECPVYDTISVIDSKTARVASKTTTITTVSNVCTSKVLRTEPQHDVPLHAPLCFFFLSFQVLRGWFYSDNNLQLLGRYL